MKATIVIVEGKEINLTNLDKKFWPGEGLTKAHLIKYYSEMALLILPYLKNRLLVMKRYPDGIGGHSFYQKDCPSYAPEWVKTFPVEHSRKIINYIICNDIATLIWLANQGCIEIHAWLSTLNNLDCPDVAVMDLDPAEGVSFSEVSKVALLVRKLLHFFDLNSFVKTSGASGLHIFVPILPEYSFEVVTECIKYIAELVVKVFPQKSTVERSVNKRYGKVYLDYLQNGRGRTMVFPYSLRPLPGAPVSTPVKWDEVPSLASSAAFTIHTIRQRVFELDGDLWREMLSYRQSLDKLVETVRGRRCRGLRELKSYSLPVELD